LQIAYCHLIEGFESSLAFDRLICGIMMASMLTRHGQWLIFVLPTLFFSFVITGIPASQQHLVWHSNELKNEQSLQDCSICSGATLQLILSMQGGPINSRRGMIFMINLTACCLFHVTDVFVLRTCSAFFSEIFLGN